MTMCALAVTLLTLASFAPAQTNAAKTSTVGTWKADLAKSTSSGPAPKAVTLTILKDAVELMSWRVDLVDDKGASMSFSVGAAPLDGTPQPR